MRWTPSSCRSMPGNRPQVPRSYSCTKCFDNEQVLTRLARGVSLIPVQNGFDPLLAAYGHEFEGIASFVSECEADRPRTRITRPGELHLGRRSADSIRLARPEMFDQLALSRLFRVVEVPAIDPFKYAKLMYSAAISPLAATAGIDNGSILSIPAARRLFFALLNENYRILSEAGMPLEKIGPFRPATVAWILGANGWPRPLLERSSPRCVVLIARCLERSRKVGPRSTTSTDIWFAWPAVVVFPAH